MAFLISNEPHYGNLVAAGGHNLFWGRFSQVGKYVVVRSSNVPMNVDWLLAVRNKRDDDAAFSSQEENIFPTKTLLCPTRLNNK